MPSLQVQNAVIGGKTGLACTDEQRRWNAGTSKNLEPKRLSQINFRHHKAEQQYSVNCRVVASQRLPNTPHHVSHKDFRDSVDKSTLQPLFVLKNTLLGKCYNASPSAEQPSTSYSAVDDTILQPHQIHNNELSCNPCKAFYQAYVEVSDAQAAQLELETREQSASDLWHNCRKIRLQQVLQKRFPSMQPQAVTNFYVSTYTPHFVVTMRLTMEKQMKIELAKS